MYESVSVMFADIDIDRLVHEMPELRDGTLEINNGKTKPWRAGYTFSNLNL